MRTPGDTAILPGARSITAREHPVYLDCQSAPPVRAGVARSSAGTTERAEETNVRTVGTARRIDQLGRVVIPAELRKVYGVRTGDLLDSRVEEGRLVLSKLEQEYVICRGGN